MYSPNHLLFSSQLYILDELLQKQAAAAKRKGVVGKIGSAIPIAPKNRQIMPAINHSALVTFCPFFLLSVFLDACLSFISQYPVTIVVYAFLVPLFNELSAYSTSPSAVPQLSFFISFLQVIVVIWLGAAVIAILNGFFYRRAFYAPSEKSGEGNFRTAGLLMIIGGALTILFVGGLIFFIGWIVATMGFSSMKPKPTQTSPILPQEVPAQAMAQKKQCLNCGAENSIDAIFCSYCGNKL